MNTIKIKENVPHKDPFVVPEGYFDTLSARVMQRIEAEAELGAAKMVKRTRLITLVWRWGAAACFVIATGLGLWRYDHSIKAVGTYDTDDVYYLSENASSEEWDEAVEYALIDNQTIAYYVTDNY